MSKHIEDKLDKFIAFEKIRKIINSCEAFEHLRSTQRLIDIFQKRFKSYDLTMLLEQYLSKRSLWIEQ